MKLVFEWPLTSTWLCSYSLTSFPPWERNNVFKLPSSDSLYVAFTFHPEAFLVGSDNFKRYLEFTEISLVDIWEIESQEVIWVVNIFKCLNPYVIKVKNPSAVKSALELGFNYHLGGNLTYSRLVEWYWCGWGGSTWILSVTGVSFLEGSE